MRGLSGILYAVVFLSASTEAVKLHSRTEGPAKVVALPIQRKDVANPVLRDRIRRRDVQQVTLDNLETLYFANGSMGTPAQSLRLHLDTGSSDLWLNTPGSKLCRDRSNPCAFAGTYSANESSTYQYISSDFNISYVDGSGAAGDYVSDTFSIGEMTLSRLQFGIGYTSSANEGILGIGYPLNEVQVGRAGKQAYQNLPARMVAEKLISSSAYSIWLNDLDASTGSILFGGVDTEQFSGTLQTLPIQSSRGSFTEFLITLTGLSFGSNTIASKQAQAVLLDTGSSLTYLPNAMTQSIYDLVSAQYFEDQGAAYVPCTLRSNTSTLDFTFSGPKISIDMSELVIEVASADGRRLIFSDGTQACLFGIAPAGSSTSVLGDTFLRSAYVVYDLANNEISLAQTIFNATKTNIQEIGTGSKSVPDATAVANPVAASNVASSDRGMASGTSTLGLDGASSTNVAVARAPPVGLGGWAALGAMFYAAM